jgi:alpha-galactosidase
MCRDTPEEGTGVKIAAVGAGSYVFGPSVLSQALLEHGLDGVELTLMDVDGEAVEALAGVGRRMARERGLAGTRVTGTTDREAALDGADFVICSASPQMRSRHAKDLEIVAEFAPGHRVSEFGGVAGISYSLRQIAFIEGLADDMRRLCPRAWLLDVANPLPRVCQAASERGVKTVGFCVVSVVAHGMVWRLLNPDKGDIRYPFTEAVEAYEIASAGLNHHAFVVRLRDRATGEDLLPRLHQAALDGATCGNPRAEKLLRETGYLLTPTDEHTLDFFTPEPGEVAHAMAQPWHGSDTQRAERIALLHAIARGEAAWDPILEKPAWERPLDLIAGLTGGKPARFTALNLVNDGQIPELPRGVFVETPATASAEGIVPERVSLPEPVVPYCARTVAVTDAIVRAALTRSRATLDEAVELDPTVTDKDAGRRAVAAVLEAHADLLPVYH